MRDERQDFTPAGMGGSFTEAAMIRSLPELTQPLSVRASNTGSIIVARRIFNLLDPTLHFSRSGFTFFGSLVCRFQFFVSFCLKLLLNLCLLGNPLGPLGNRPVGRSPMKDVSHHSDSGDGRDDVARRCLNPGSDARSNPRRDQGSEHQTVFPVCLSSTRAFWMWVTRYQTTTPTPNRIRPQ